MKKIDEYLTEYAKKFGDGFPSFQLMRARSPEDTIEIIKDCIDKGKDAYELGYVTDEIEVEY